MRKRNYKERISSNPFKIGGQPWRYRCPNKVMKRKGDGGNTRHGCWIYLPCSSTSIHWTSSKGVFRCYWCGHYFSLPWDANTKQMAEIPEGYEIKNGIFKKIPTNPDINHGIISRRAH